MPGIRSIRADLLSSILEDEDRELSEILPSFLGLVGDKDEFIEHAEDISDQPFDDIDEDELLGIFVLYLAGC